MMLIEEINEDELTSSYSKYTYHWERSIFEYYNTDDVADQIDITINGDKYKDNPYENISTSQQCYITIVVTDNTNEKETEYNIQLDRSALARDNTITTLSWSIYDVYGNSLPTKDILMLEEGVEYDLPFMVNRISLDYFVTANDYAVVSVILDNGNSVVANNEPIMVDTTKSSTTVYVEGQIDDAFTTYSLTFNKAIEASADNNLISLDIEGYSETDYFTPAVVTVTEGTSDYTAIVSKEVTEFCVYHMHLM